jgi:hypothetical protein
MTTPGREQYTLVLDNLHVEDKPEVIGLFVLERAREMSRRYGHIPPMTLHIGTADAIEVARRQRDTGTVHSSRLRAGEVGPLYRLITAVEYGQKNLAFDKDEQDPGEFRDPAE